MAKENLLLGTLVGTLLSMALVTFLLFVRAGPIFAVFVSGVLAGYIAGSLSKGAIAGLVSGALGPLFSLGAVLVVFRALLQRLTEIVSVSIPPGFRGLYTLALVLAAVLLMLLGGAVGLLGGLVGGAVRKFTGSESRYREAEVAPPPPP